MPSSPTAPPITDFFVSYTGKDQAWAEWIAWQLEHAGYSTVIQAWDFKSGGVFPGDMHRGLQQSTRVLAVLTPDYMKSKFCAPEWQAPFKQDPTGEKGILICVRVADFEPDGLLAGRTYIDLVGKAPDAARDYILARLKTGRAKPAKAPPHPGTSTVPIFPGTASAPPDSIIRRSLRDIPHNLPGGYIGQVFMGRDDFLAEVETSLSGRTPTVITQANPGFTSITGLGGMGKTHTAVAYAHRHADHYTACLFVSGESKERLNAGLAGLCSVLHLDTERSRSPVETDRVAAVLDWFVTHRDWLLIVDNVDNEEAAVGLVGYFGQLLNGHVLITSRLHHWPNQVHALDLGVLSADHATELLLKLTEGVHNNTPDDHVQARLLAADLDGLPLALHQAAGYINEEHLSLAEARRVYQDQARDLLGWFNQLQIPYAAPQDIGPLPVLFTWKASFDKLSPDTRRWLRVFAYFAPETIPDFLLSSAAAAEDEVKARHRAARKALAQAAKFSLLTFEKEPSGFKLHRLVQHIIRLSATEEERAIALAEGIQFIGESNPGDPSDVRTWPRWNPLQAHVQALCAHAPDALAPRGLTWLLNELGMLLETKGLYTQAEPLIRRALAMGETSLGKDHPKVALCLNNLAQLLQATNRYAEAEPLMRRGLAIDQASFGKDHPKVANRLNNLAQLLQATNRYVEAEPLMRRALAIDQASFGKDHPTVARDLHNLAGLLQDTNRLAEAEPLMRRALAMVETSFGKDHPKVALCLSNLALLLKATNRLAEAEQLMRRALAIDETGFGPEHPNVARSLNNLARLLQITDRLAEAEPLMRRALAIDEASFGNDHPKVANGLDNLARLLQATDRLAEAEPLMRRALAIFVASLGADHPSSQTVQRNLDILLAAKG